MAAAGLPLEPAVGDLATMCERTKATLGSLITRPPMKDKLLSRPPFRFIHDAVTAVTAATGFLDGAFQGAELKPKEMERDEKHNYLTKLISLVERATRSSLGVDPVNVAAGKEPEMTNYLLQVSRPRENGRWNHPRLRRGLRRQVPPPPRAQCSRT